MDQNLSKLIESLNSLKTTISEAAIHENGFHAHGWNQVHLKKSNISFIISNYINKLNDYGSAQLTEDLEDTIEYHIEAIDALNTTAKSHFTNNANHLIHIVPVILLTLNTVFSDIDYELFSYENLQDKKLLPRGLSRRLRSTSTRIESINESSSSLEEKIATINEAHEAAESLPTDLASLKEAKKDLNKLIRNATLELNETKEALESIKETAAKHKNDTKNAREETEKSRNDAKISADTAARLVEECDDALQITTTQGLAAGFDQKASELKRSIWIWIIGLLVALGFGAWIGAERVDAFTKILNNNLTAGQAILHTVMSIFSIGGPLWLAWISTRQINQRFKLSEDYSYKATVAKSFTGFKKLAERFEPSTEERLFNSTLDRLDEMPLRLIEDKDYSSPWHEFTNSESFKSAITMFPDLAQEAGRFASKTSLKVKARKSKGKAKSQSMSEREKSTQNTEH